jgi:hypothetical protein
LSSVENPPFGKTGSVEKLLRRVVRCWFQPVGCAALGAALRRVLTGALRTTGLAETAERTGAACATATGAAATKACAPDMAGIAPPPCCCACPIKGSVETRSRTRNMRRMIATPDKALTVLHCIRRAHRLQRYPQFVSADFGTASGLSRHPGLCYNRGAVKHTGQQEIAPAAAKGVVVGESGPSAQSASETSTHRQEDVSRYCPVCSQRLESRRCKLICNVCGYYMSCADYY